MGALLERLGVGLPIAQAGMGGGCAGHMLAAAVSEAGALGTIGTVDASALARELAAARRLTERPIAINLLLPFARRAHFEAAAKADATVTFWGTPRRPTPGIWLHQCGSVDEARAARGAGADGVIVQGVEAGGHVRGALPALELLERTRAALPDLPVWLAGGIAERADVETSLEAGAEGVVAGTRFLATEECAAHPAYKRRVVSDTETLLTELFGFGWAAPHRVLQNEATRRWCENDPLGPAAVRVANKLTGPLLRRLPQSVQQRGDELRRPGVPLLSPALPLAGDPDARVESMALYAGETVARIHDVQAAARVVESLTPRRG